MSPKTTTHVIVHNPDIPGEWPIGKFDIRFYTVKKNESYDPEGNKYNVTRMRRREHNVSGEYVGSLRDKLAKNEAVHAVCRDQTGSVTICGSDQAMSGILEEWEVSGQSDKGRVLSLPYRKPFGAANDLLFWLRRHVEEKNDPNLHHAFRRLDRWLKTGFQPLPHAWSRRMRPEHRLRFDGELWRLGQYMTEGNQVWKVEVQHIADTAHHMGYLPIYYMLRSVFKEQYKDPVEVITQYRRMITDQTLLDPYVGERGRPGWLDDGQEDRRRP